VRNPFGRLVRDVDIVFDTVGGETLKRSWSLLKPRGRMVTIAAESEGTKDERIEKAFFIVEPNQKELTEISRLLDSGELQCFVDAVVPFVRASDASRKRTVPAQLSQLAEDFVFFRGLTTREGSSIQERGSKRTASKTASTAKIRKASKYK
jgi:Zinc-binding dehydrogenase